MKQQILKWTIYLEHFWKSKFQRNKNIRIFRLSNLKPIYIKKFLKLLYTTEFQLERPTLARMYLYFKILK